MTHLGERMPPGGAGNGARADDPPFLVTRDSADPHVPAGEDDGFAVVAFREDGVWSVSLLPVRLVADLGGLVHALAQQPSDVGSIGLVDVADEFFLAVRVRGDDVRLLLSDVAAALDFDVAAQALDRLGVQPPSEEDLDDDVWPAGDLSIFADLGFSEMELGAVLADDEAWPDETLAAIADRLGFGAAFERAVDAATG
jgi:putative tRNA adenosine deaminase-associated protein